ncbi:PREDICTED: centrosomal protein of 112 kDa-like isoform X2 [Amphimedon queenslandica]|uniref:DUF4485 domain-containing protein n=1 Tax=Amphimedon queenslandica TaxID=400682 RepID=A0AAN0JEY9_AMPQE|nr:PREDICTED: centrosomal protein of 112 kDa-like isoform X2 [Amphimedon queenslandica]|eukprot:XP_019855605.1 PREDICTED: centrosomal protein of 112 kDa-like isoform X2 [Amphimedon queenslandica]
MDDEFMELFQRIKSLAKNLQRGSDDRHYVALWIKKLISERKNDKATCNHYTRLLLNSLQQTKLQPPFTAIPPSGPLPLVKDELDKLLSTSPEYHTTDHPSIPDNFSFVQQPNHKLTETFPPTAVPSLKGNADRNISFTSPGRGANYKSSVRSLSLSPRWKQARTTRKLLKFNSSDSSSDDDQDDIKTSTTAKSSTPNKAPTNVKSLQLDYDEGSDELSEAFAEISFPQSLPNRHPSLLLGNSSHLIAAKTQNESMQHSNGTIKNFLDQKNSEIESLRMEYSQKTCQLEHKCHQLEMKASQLESQLSIKKEQQSKELQRIKQESQQQLLQSKNKLKKKFQGIISDLEKEKVDMEHEKFQNLQAVIEDANGKLLSLETEKISLKRIVQDLESKNHQLTQQLDITQQMKDTYLKQKNQLQEDNGNLEASIKQANERIKMLEESYIQITAEKEDTIKEMAGQAEKDISALKTQMKHNQLSAANDISCLQKEVKTLQNYIEDINASHKQKVKEIESSNQKQLSEKETKIKELDNSFKQLQMESSDSLSILKATLKEKDSKYNDLESRLELQTKKLEKANKEHHSSMQKVKDQHIKAMQHKQKVIENLEKSLCDVTRKFEEQPGKLEAKHKERQANELSILNEKYAVQIQHLQHDYEIKIALAEESIASLSMQVKDLQEEQERMKVEQDEEIKQLQRGNELELNQIRSHFASEEAAHQQAIAEAIARSEELKTQLVQQKKAHEAQLSQVKANIDQKQILTRKEYEDTIQALKLEIDLLNQRAEVLQKQLAQFHTCSSLRKHIKSCHKKY